jgi:hypothetical protein
MIIVVPSCLKDADGARTRSDQKQPSTQNSYEEYYKAMKQEWADWLIVTDQLKLNIIKGQLKLRKTIPFCELL